MVAQSSARRLGPGRDIAGLAISIGLSLLAGAIGAAATFSSVNSWYPTLHKPDFNPPNAVFGPVWTALYLMMATAAWRVWRRHGPAARTALTLYGLQLLLNLAWSLIFFGLHRIALALVEILALLALVAGTAASFWRRDRIAAALMIPYAAWVAFAATLNFAIWRLN